jgi:hypothetical protein
MVHGGHENQKPSGERDVASDTGALLPNGLFGNLNQDFLAFFQEFADLRDYLILATAKTTAWTASSATAVLIAITPTALCTL